MRGIEVLVSFRAGWEKRREERRTHPSQNSRSKSRRSSRLMMRRRSCASHILRTAVLYGMLMRCAGAQEESATQARLARARRTNDGEGDSNKKRGGRTRACAEPGSRSRNSVKLCAVPRVSPTSCCR